MIEYGTYPAGDIPKAVKDAATREMANYLVSFVVDQRLVGSGTLVQVNEIYGVLTANHVATVLERSRQSVGINIADRPHGFFVPQQCLEYLVIGAAAENANEDSGPDLCVIRLLDLNDLATIKSKKSFYRLQNANIGKFWEELPIEQMPWYLAGAPDERCRSSGIAGTPSHILTTQHFHGEARFVSLTTRGQFDYLVLELAAGAYDYPLHYGGVSGGASWVLPLTMDPVVGKSTIGYDAPLLAGVAYYEDGLRNGHRRVRCHGPESVHIRARDALLSSLRSIA